MWQSAYNRKNICTLRCHIFFLHIRVPLLLIQRPYGILLRCAVGTGYDDSRGHGQHDGEGDEEYPPVERDVIGKAFEPARHDQVAHGSGKEEGKEHHLHILTDEHTEHLAYLRSVDAAYGNLRTLFLL